MAPATADNRRRAIEAGAVRALLRLLPAPGEAATRADRAFHTNMRLVLDCIGCVTLYEGTQAARRGAWGSSCLL